MRSEITKILVQILLTCQLILTLADFAHTESLVFGALPDAVENHDCGAREIHKPLDSCQPCLPCCRITHSVALPEAVSFNAPVFRTPLAKPHCSRLFEVSVSSSVPKRGPPDLAAL